MSDLTDRLRGQYPVGVNSEFGVRDFSDFIPPISKEAADRIDELEAALTLISTARRVSDSPLDLVESLSNEVLDTPPPPPRRHRAVKDEIDTRFSEDGLSVIGYIPTDKHPYSIATFAKPWDLSTSVWGGYSTEEVFNTYPISKLSADVKHKLALFLKGNDYEPNGT